MARIVINPACLHDSRDRLCVAFNEAFRVVMEDTGFEPQSEPTDEQRKFFSDTAYSGDELQLRRTILARICTFDTSVKDPTDEQLQEAVEFLETVMEIGAPQNEWEQKAVQRLHDMVSTVLENGTEDTSEPPPPPSGGSVQADEGGGETGAEAAAAAQRAAEEEEERQRREEEEARKKEEESKETRQQQEQQKPGQQNQQVQQQQNQQVQQQQNQQVQQPVVQPTEQKDGRQNYADYLAQRMARSSKSDREALAAKYGVTSEGLSRMGFDATPDRSTALRQQIDAATDARAQAAQARGAGDAANKARLAAAEQAREVAMGERSQQRFARSSASDRDAMTAEASAGRRLGFQGTPLTGQRQRESQTAFERAQEDAERQRTRREGYEARRRTLLARKARKAGFDDREDFFGRRSGI